MTSRFIKQLVLISLISNVSVAYADGITLGLNLEFVDGSYNEETFDGGLGIQVGYEFKNIKQWDIGILLEHMDGWNSEKNLDLAGDLMFQSTSLFVTARPNNWPIMFKAGLVDAEYKILLQDFTQNFKQVNKTGYAYGVALMYGRDNFRINLLDIKRIEIGDDSFTSFGITIAILGN